MRWYKAACWVLVVLALVHSLSFLTGPPKPANETEAKLDDLMANYKRDLMGVQRSEGDLFKGFLISFSVLPLTMGIAGLLVGREAAPHIAAVYCGGLLVMTLVSIVWWFPAPTAFLAAATICFGVARMKIA